jgi:hypothetical protein
VATKEGVMGQVSRRGLLWSSLLSALVPARATATPRRKPQRRKQHQCAGRFVSVDACFTAVSAYCAATTEPGIPEQLCSDYGGECCLRIPECHAHGTLLDCIRDRQSG